MICDPLILSSFVIALGGLLPFEFVSVVCVYFRFSLFALRLRSALRYLLFFLRGCVCRVAALVSCE